jgi:hypothetical protein
LFFLRTNIVFVFSVDKSNTPESDKTINNTSGVNNEEDKSVFESLRESRKLHPRNFTTA